jgi:hypothetical protein
MDLAENVSAAGGEHLNLSSDLIPNLLRGGLGQNRLGIDTSAPEGQFTAVFRLQFSRLEPGQRILHGVEAVHPYLDKVGDDRFYGAVAVQIACDFD